MEEQKILETMSDLIVETSAFRRHFLMGLALSKSANDFVRLPLGKSLREATFKVFEAGPLHNFLEKGWSEPSLAGQVENYPE
jgi:hypothetical protein